MTRKKKLLALTALAAAMIAPVALAGTAFVRTGNGNTIQYNCTNTCVVMYYANGSWSVTDSGGGTVTATLWTRMGPMPV